MTDCCTYSISLYPIFVFVLNFIVHLLDTHVHLFLSEITNYTDTGGSIKPGVHTTHTALSQASFLLLACTIESWLGTRLHTG